MSRFDRVETLLRAGHIANIDQQLAALLAEFDGGEDADTALAAALASKHTREGHSCVDLCELAGRRWPEAADTGSGAVLPEAEPWLRRLSASPVVSPEGPAANRPLVLTDAGRLYLLRIWRRERQVAAKLRELASADGAICNRDALALAEEWELEAGVVRAAAPAPKLVKKVLHRLFAPDGPDSAPQRAARAAINHRLCCISGGPGTGKTTAVAKIMLALVELGLTGANEIVLMAPTGKAAARLREATRNSLGELRAAGKSTAWPEDLAVEAVTVHRWLRYGEEKRALAGVLIIDEASMMDIHRMSEVLQAMSAGARLILLGDAGQLSSVEPGSVFADVCGAANHDESPLRDCVVKLTKNWRFDAHSGIGRLAAALHRGDGAAAEAALVDANEEAIRLEIIRDHADFEALAERFTRDHYAPMLRRFQDPLELRQLAVETHPFRGFMALCALRRGRFGSAYFNELVERRLRALGLAPAAAEFYPGRPIIITRNDPRSGLANGDAGIVLRNQAGATKVWFPDLGDAAGGPKLLSPSRLPPHENSFALTVHRSQGSEYNAVAIITAPAESPSNSRELLYTAVTRARREVTIHGDRAAPRRSTERETRRWSGLLEALAKPQP